MEGSKLCHLIHTQGKKLEGYMPEGQPCLSLGYGSKFLHAFEVKEILFV